ncbi:MULTISPECIES: condensation domain-containing protein [unclassified Streptomyces]|uniref:condensation domain-containing protein n=1 Tax=unclassified Streptomyces TaxID=2593676 RepID=UPI000DB97E45|nr:MULTISPECIES: condensation domain-containing protein [unclassified Streptomyces]MYT68897.1 condensation protein [Streptomyces sp. SID8367]RAJ82402.1 condensation domain-containing protein [Streptomyces sp. PsTaAH-137]
MTDTRAEPVPWTEQTHTVHYAGGVARSGPLAVGQTNMIRCILRDDPVQINIHDVWPAPEHTSVERAVDALRVLVERHEALRTTFPHRHGELPVEQRVAADGTFHVTERAHRSLPGEQAPRHAESVARASRHGRFRLDRDFPLRITLLTRDGTVTQVALAASHAATDGTALAILHDEWRALVTGDALPAPDALAPLDLAAEETSPAGRRKSEASLRYWERVLRTAPQAMFAEPRLRSGDHDTAQLSLRSARAARALRAVTARTGSPAPTVLLAAWCTLAAHRAGQRTCVAAAPTSNRNRSGLARSVNTLSQDALLSLDMSGPTFDTVLRRTWGAALDAYRHSRFDSVRLWNMIDSVTRERGSRFARDVVFNDVSSVPATSVGTAAPDGDDEPRELSLTWGPEQQLPTRLLTFVHAVEPELRLSLWADPALFTRAETEDQLTGLVRLLEAAAHADVPLDRLTAVTGVRPATRDADWYRVDGCWISRTAVERAVSDAAGRLPAHAGVTHDPAGTGPDEDAHVLTAFVVAPPDGPAPTPHGIHTALMTQVAHRSELLAPSRYVIVRDAPHDPTDTAAWHRLPVLDEGNGRAPADAT